MESIRELYNNVSHALSSIPRAAVIGTIMCTVITPALAALKNDNQVVSSEFTVLPYVAGAILVVAACALLKKCGPPRQQQDLAALRRAPAFGRPAQRAAAADLDFSSIFLPIVAIGDIVRLSTADVVYQNVGLENNGREVMNAIRLRMPNERAHILLAQGRSGKHQQLDLDVDQTVAEILEAGDVDTEKMKNRLRPMDLQLVIPQQSKRFKTTKSAMQTQRL
ncbi:MAG: hypothetical protein Q8K75_03515 [Chlamydiales bacterium]|nr:hypothetical protein [Chlamydiales bacterium]